MKGTMFFWKSTTMRGDPLCFIDRGKATASAALLFPPERFLSLHNAAGDVEYEEGRDFRLDAAAGLVIRTRDSRIPLTGLAELDPPGDDDLFHRRQVCAAYTHRPGLWIDPVPRFRGADLPRTMSRLLAGKPLALAVTGDSISEGYNASGFAGVPPYQPPYVDLITAGLTGAYGSPMALNNLASAGWTSDNGLADAERVGATHPDLMIIAFGMNDAGYAEPADFAANIAGIMDVVRREAPDAEFVLVSPMLPNPDWHYPVMERFAAYRDALDTLCATGVILGDVTTMWKALLYRKSVHDLTGNGINHPNDFGHQVYAQALLALLIDEIQTPHG